MQLHETIEILKKLYIQDLTVQNFYSSCLLISWYTEDELKKLFREKNEIAQYLESFLLTCYVSRNILDVLKEEFIKLNKIFDNNNEQNAFSFVYSYINCLKQVADNFDEIGITSLSSQYSNSYDNFKIVQKKYLDMLKYANFEFKSSDVEKVFKSEKNKLFENNSKILKELENEFMSMMLNQVNVENIDEVEKLIYNYYDLKILCSNYSDDYQRNNLVDLCYYIVDNSHNHSDEFLLNYNLANRFEYISTNYCNEIYLKSNYFDNKVYVFKY